MKKPMRMLIVGDTWVLNNECPFEGLKVEILSLKDDWVQYRFESHPTKWNLPQKDFKRMYNVVHRTNG